MIVAIINQTSPVGVVRVDEFRLADTAADAVTAFVNGYTPPRDPADWLGVDTGWGGVAIVPAPANNHWAYDFGAPALVATPNTEAALAEIKSRLLGDPLNGLTVAAVAAGLSVTTNIQLLVKDDVTTVLADPAETKFLRVSYVYNSATDTFSVEAYEKTTGDYEDYTPPEYLVRELGEWFVVAGGTDLVAV